MWSRNWAHLMNIGLTRASSPLHPRSLAFAAKHNASNKRRHRSTSMFMAPLHRGRRVGYPPRRSATVGLQEDRILHERGTSTRNSAECVTTSQVSTAQHTRLVEHSAVHQQTFGQTGGSITTKKEKKKAGGGAGKVEKRPTKHLQ